MECPLYAKLCARSFQELLHLLFRAASELGITNPDEEIEAKGGELEEMRKNMYKNFFLIWNTNENEACVFKKYYDFSLHHPTPPVFLMSPKGWD